LWREIYQRNVLLDNVKDSFFGAFQPNEYFQGLKKLIDHLRDPELNYQNGNMLAHLLEDTSPQTLSVSDVYVPYCYLHPDKITTVKGTFKGFDVLGSSQFDSKGKHDVVFNLDYQHFAEFLKENIR
ncbi:MAG: hypothetical protein AABX16_01105, partial [Nanoarchaeota archaeon]